MPRHVIPVVPHGAVLPLLTDMAEQAPRHGGPLHGSGAAHALPMVPQRPAEALQDSPPFPLLLPRGVALRKEQGRPPYSLESIVRQRV